MFYTLKNKILQAPCLALVDMINKSRELDVHIDALQYTLGGLLMGCTERNWILVVYHSYKFILAEEKL